MYASILPLASLFSIFLLSLWVFFFFLGDFCLKICSCFRGEGKQAAECLRAALRDYNLKFSIILNDPDLASFRALPEFKQLQEEVVHLFSLHFHGYLSSYFDSGHFSMLWKQFFFSSHAFVGQAGR